MKILIAPDKFKGSLSAAEVADAIEEGLGEKFHCRKLPIADGGEGTSETICAALSGNWVNCEAQDPLGRMVEAGYALVESGQTAVMDMSQASGLWRLAPEELNPAIASTFGTGEMIRDAWERGVNHIILGIGGSATNDGGSGMAQALGFRFLGESGELEVPRQLAELRSIDASKAIQLPKITTACDVTNPLLGQSGATQVYGPQKGIQEADFAKFEQRFEMLAKIATDVFGSHHQNVPGAGAAGGLGFGCLSFCGAELKPGFDLVSELLDLENEIASCDLVITGEGSLDQQTLNGKGPHGVATLARKLGKPLVAFVGRTDGSEGLEAAFGGKIVVIGPESMPVEESMCRAGELLRTKARVTLAGASFGRKP